MKTKTIDPNAIFRAIYFTFLIVCIILLASIFSSQSYSKEYGEYSMQERFEIYNNLYKGEWCNVKDKSFTDYSIYVVHELDKAEFSEHYKIGYEACAVDNTTLCVGAVIEAPTLIEALSYLVYEERMVIRNIGKADQNYFVTDDGYIAVREESNPNQCYYFQYELGVELWCKGGEFFRVCDGLSAPIPYEQILFAK